jgi:hypothetical protein
VTGQELSLFVHYEVREASGDRQRPMYGPLGLAAPVAEGHVLFHFPE